MPIWLGMCGPPEAPQLGSPATTRMRQGWEVFQRIGVKRMFLHQQLEILLFRYRRRRPIAQTAALILPSSSFAFTAASSAPSPPAPSVGPRDQPLQPPLPSERIPPLQKGMRPLAILWSGL